MKFVQIQNTNMSNASNVIKQIVSEGRRAAMLDKEKMVCNCTINLNKMWALSMINNAHNNDDLMEGSAWFEIAVVKNGRTISDASGTDILLIDIRYDVLLYVLAKSKTVSSLLFNLEYWSSLFFSQDLDVAYKSAERLLRLAENA